MSCQEIPMSALAFSDNCLNKQPTLRLRSVQATNYDIMNTMIDILVI